VKRREFITLVGGAAAWPFAARAQQAIDLDFSGLLPARGREPNNKAAFSFLQPVLDNTID
jgi:hypothetical protein